MSSTTHNAPASTHNAPASTQNAQAKLSNVADTVTHHPIVQQGSQQVTHQLNLLDRELAKFGFLNDFEAKTKIPKTYGVLGFSITLGLIILLNLFGLASPVTNLIGWLLPAYLSCKALESQGHEDDKQWLTYWIVFGLFNFLESGCLRLVLYYFPMYFTFKIIAIVWLVLPQTRGAEMIYNTVVRPAFQASKSKITSTPTTSTSANTTTLPSYPTSASANSSTGFNPAGTTTTSATPAMGGTTGYSTSAETAMTEGLTERAPQAAGAPLPDMLI